MAILPNSVGGVDVSGWAGLAWRGLCSGLLGALAWCVLFGISPRAQAQAVCQTSVMGIDDACLWLKADDGAGTSDTPVSTWQDSSRNGKDLGHGVTFLSTEASPDLLSSARSPARPPDLIAGSATTGMNFNPVVSFDGARQRVARRGSTIGTDVSEITLFFVTRERQRQHTVPFYHWYRGYDLEPRVSIHWAWVDDSRIYWDRGICCSSPAGRNKANAPFAAGVANLGLTTYSVINNRADLVVNAQTLDVQEPSSARFSAINLPGSLTVLGAWYDGDIPELLEFKRDLTPTERTRVQSYLALKYGLTLDRNGLKDKAYTSGNDASVYSHSDYWNSIIGIGYDTRTGLDQRVSRSTQKISTGDLWVASGDSPLTLATSLDFTSANNNDGRPALQPGQYLVLGDNNGDVATLGDATAEQFGRRIGRVWRAQNTGGVGAVYLGFDPTLLETNFPQDKRGFLLVSTDADFSVANTTRYALGRVTVGGKAVFTPVTDIGQTEPLAITIPNGSYITLGQESVCTGTALGIADACLWLKANDGGLTPGGTVSTWQDRSGSQKHMTGVGNPSVVAGSNTAGMNFNPVVRFNGVDQSMWRNESTIGTDVSEANIFFAMRETVRQGWAARTLLSHFTFPYPVSRWGFQWLIHWPRGYDDKLAWDHGIWDEPRHRNLSSAPFAVGVSNLGLVTNSVSSDTATIVVNAKTLTDEMPPSPGIRVTGTDLSNTLIGTTNLGSAERHLHGDIPEFLEFKRNLTAPQRTRVQSYLALKYGLTLDPGGLEGNVYTSGSDRAVYSDGDYWHSIIGLGRDDDVTKLDQRVSRSMQKIGPGTTWVASGDSPLTIATTPDFTSANGNPRRQIFNGQYLVLGDNDGALDTFSADALGQRGNRIPRVWRAQNTLPRISGDLVTAVFLGFDPALLPASFATAGDLYLLVSSDADFSAATTARYPLKSVTLGGKDFLTPVVGEGSSTPGAVSLLPNVSYISLGQGSAQACASAVMGITDACAWYRADRGLDDNRNWPDQSGARNTAIVNGSPSLTPNSVNFNATVDYRGGAGHTLPATADVINRYTFLGLARMTGTHHGRAFSDRFNNRLFGYWGGPNPKQDVWVDVTGYSEYGGNMYNVYSVYERRSAETAPQTRPMLYTLRHNADGALSLKSNGRTLYDDNIVATSKYRMTLANGGTYFEQDAGYADVSIPEFFSFKRALSDAEIDKVESYLALKYGVTLGSAADPKNYVNSANQAIWTANRGGYQHRVFGLGRDNHAIPNNSTTLDQRVSKSTDHTLDDTRNSILTIATSADFTSANGGSRPALQPGQYLVLGDNDGALNRLSASALGSSLNRLPRVWRAQNTGDVGPVFLGLEAAKVSLTDTGRRYLFVESGANADGSFPPHRTRTYALSNTLTDLTGYWVPVANGAAVAVNIPDGAYLSYGVRLGPAVTLTVQSRGGVGEFRFSGNRSFVPSSATTTTEMQPRSTPEQWLPDDNGDLVISVAMPSAAGWRLEAASCIDRQAAASGNPSGAVLGRVSASDKFTIPAAQAKASADLHCALVARYDSGSTLKTVSGRVFIDNGAGGGVANDGKINGAETGRSGAALSLTNCGSGAAPPSTPTPAAAAMAATA